MFLPTSGIFQNKLNLRLKICPNFVAGVVLGVVLKRGSNAKKFSKTLKKLSTKIDYQNDTIFPKQLKMTITDFASSYRISRALEKLVPQLFIYCDIVFLMGYLSQLLGVSPLWGRPGFDRMSPDKKYSSLVNLNTKQKITGKNYSFVNARTSNAQLALA